jgi:hypothetical protein
VQIKGDRAYRRLVSRWRVLRHFHLAFRFLVTERVSVAVLEREREETKEAEAFVCCPSAPGHVPARGGRSSRCGHRTAPCTRGEPP